MSGRRVWQRFPVILAACLGMGAGCDDKPSSSTPKGKEIKTGPDAYDDLPEPWRTRLTSDWKTHVDRHKARVETASNSVQQAKDKLKTAEEDLSKFYKRNPGKLDAGLKQVENSFIDKAEAAKLSIENAEASLNDAKETLAAAEKNKPAFLASEFAGCGTVDDLETREAQLEAKRNKDADDGERGEDGKTVLV